MVELNQLVNWCNNTLNAAAFKDYCPNGLQVEGKSHIHKIITAVTASQTAIDAAIAEQADALIVHHGYFWKGEPSPLTGMKGKRIKALMQHDISLIAYHLPLDAHPTLGNNIALAELLGIETTGALDPSEHYPIGNIGTLRQALSVEQLSTLLTDKLHRPAQHMGQGPALIKKIGFCTGGAQDYLYKAVDQGCDAYISGEVSERTFHETQELGIHYFACGHHATERGGIIRLGQALAKQFNVIEKFIDISNPV
jgi:dinuclear metal center YbgI/SA1388 family protein